MKNTQLFIVLISLLALSSCKVLNSSIMFQTEKEYQFDQLPDSVMAQYKIAPNDILDFRLLSNEGFRMLDMSTAVNTESSGGGAAQAMNTGMQYLVEFDGMVKLPIVGRVQVAGMTIREAEKMLQEMYLKYYNDPFVLLSVVNKRVIVFPGEGGTAQVVRLENENTTLIEALALVGGVAETGKAFNVKLIRKLNDKDIQVYQMDLSTIQGIKDANTVLQAYDIIYIEPRRRTAMKLAQEISPYFQVFSTLALLLNTIYLVQRINQ